MPGGDLLGGHARRRQRLIVQDPDIGVKRAIKALDAIEIRAGQLDGGKLLGGDQRRRLGNGQETGVGGGHGRRSAPAIGRKTCAGSTSIG